MTVRIRPLPPSSHDQLAEALDGLGELGVAVTFDTTPLTAADTATAARRAYQARFVPGARWVDGRLYLAENGQDVRVTALRFTAETQAVAAALADEMHAAGFTVIWDDLRVAAAHHTWRDPK